MTNQDQNIMTSRSFKLGAEEMDLLRGLCTNWGVSQSEAVRRAVRQAASGAGERPVEPETATGDEPAALFELLDTRLDYICLDVSKLATRIDHLAERLPSFGEVTYGVVSLDEVDEDIPVSSECSCCESSSGKKKKKKSKKAKKGTR